MKGLAKLSKYTFLTEEEKRKLYGNYTEGFSKQQSNYVARLNQEDEISKANELKAIEDQTLNKNSSLCQKMVVSIDNPVANVWDFYILLLIAYSVITTLYYIAFESTISTGQAVWEWIVFFCFWIDIIFRFFFEYRDSENLEVVHSHKKISWHYFSGWFLLDVLAAFPWQPIFEAAFGTETTQKLIIIRLITRIFRLPKFFRQLDCSKFDNLLDLLQESKGNNQKNEKSRQEKMNIKYISRYVYKVFRQVFIAMFLTYFLGCLWYFQINLSINNQENNFYQSYLEQWPSNGEKLVWSCYFVLTTLSTVGYGDLYPISNYEKIIGIWLMIVGIAFFSFIMGSFNDVLINYDKKMGNVDKRTDLQMWLTSLNKFNPQPVPKELVQRIDDHFKFFWQHDRLSGLTPDDQYLMTMPAQLRMQLVNFLFDDIFTLFRGFLNKKKFQNSTFYYDIAFLLLPRRYEPGATILKKGTMAEEIYLVLDGEISVGLEFEVTPIMRFYTKGFYFGEFSVLYEKPQIYDYKATTVVKILAQPKYKFLKVLENYPDIQSELKANVLQKTSQMNKRFQRMLKEKITEVHQYTPTDKEIHKFWDEHVMIKKEMVLSGGGINNEMAKRILRHFKTKSMKSSDEADGRVQPKYSKQRLNHYDKKLEETDKNLSIFKDELKGFCGFMNKEIGEITYRLENLKTTLIEQEKAKL